MSMSNRGPIAAVDFAITPSMIDARGKLWGAFDHDETETSAMWVVRYMQDIGAWLSFTHADIEQFYNDVRARYGNTPEPFKFNRLINPGNMFYILRGIIPEGGGWIVLCDDGKYRVTEDFVNRCYKSSPA